MDLLMIILHVIAVTVNLHTMDTKNVSYTNQGLTTMPSGLPNDTVTLDLSNNKLIEIHVNELVGLYQLKELFLHENRLTTVPELIAVRNTLKVLKLHNNLITFIPAHVFDSFTLTFLSLGGYRLTSLPDLSILGCSLTYLGVASTQLIYIPDLRHNNPASFTINVLDVPLNLCACENVWLKQAEKEGATVKVDDKTNPCWSDAGHHQLQIQCANCK